MTSVSTLCSRASSAPQMAMRLSVPCAGLTISGAISASITSGHSLGGEGERRRGRDQPAQEFGQLFAGVAGIELAQAAIGARGRELPAPRRWRWTSRDKIDLRLAAEGGQRRQRCVEAREHGRARHRCARAVRRGSQKGGRLPRRQSGQARLEQRSARRCDVGPAGAAAQRHQFDRSRPRGAPALRSRPSAQQRMLEQRQQGDRIAGPEDGLQAPAAAARPAGVSASGVPPESSATTPKRRSSAETRRARSRSPVTSAALLAGLLDRRRSAMRDRHRLVALVGGLEQRHAGEARRRSRAASKPVARLRPSNSVVSAGRSASPTSAARSASAGSGTPISSTSRAQHADLADQFGQAVLRMAEHGGLGAGCRRARPRSARPASGRGRAARPRRAAGGRSPQAVRRWRGWSRWSRRR